MNNECVELKNIKYKSMLLTGNVENKKETVENVSNLDLFLEDEKKNIFNEPWNKLDKTTKLIKFNDFVNNYNTCLLYTSDAADDSLRVDLGGRRIIKKFT